MPESLFQARMTISREHLDSLMELCAVLEPPPTSWEDVDTGEAWFDIHGADRTDVEARARRMADIARDYDGRIHAFDVTELLPEDWTEAWKKFFHTTRISPRIVIHPSWEEFSPEPDDIVVDIDPGMSFGTGLHPTTRSCLALLDQIAVGEQSDGMTRRQDMSPVRLPSSPSLSDLGCGSGILAIAAHKLGFASIHATDFDPVAIRTTCENIALNCIPPEAIITSVADILKDPIPVADVIVANILAPILIAAAPRIVASIAGRIPSPILVLSGILDTQFADIENAYAAHGYHPVHTLLHGQWRTGIFHTRPAHRRRD